MANSLLQAVILWQVYAISGSTLSLGIVGLVGFVSALLSSLIGGMVVDAYDRRLVLFTAQTVPGLCSLALLAAIATDHVTLELIYASVLVTGLASSFESPARQAILPALIPRRLFTRAMTTNSALSSLTSISGPALAGLLIAFGGVGHAYAVHATLVALSILALTRLHVPPAKAAGRIHLEAIREGLAFVWHRKVLLGAMTLDMFAVLFGGARALLPVYAVDILHADAAGYGILTASLDLGALLAATCMIILPTPTRTGRALLASIAAFGLATIAFGASRSLPFSVLAYAAVGAADQVSVVMRLNTIQLSLPDELRGRITAVNFVFVNASNQIGGLESGVVAALTSAMFAVVSGGFACLAVVAIVAWRIPELRTYQARHAPRLS
jgi:MFS family permease